MLSFVPRFAPWPVTRPENVGTADLDPALLEDHILGGGAVLPRGSFPKFKQVV